MGLVKLAWSVTPWATNGKGGWRQQPVILVEGRPPFFADSPVAYVAELERLHDDPGLAPGPFWTLIGQLKDGLEQSWLISEPEVIACTKP